MKQEQQISGQMIYPCEKCKKIYCEKGCGDEEYCKSCGADLPPK
jgi:rRNA maturation endonuclease Nob1